MAPQPTIPDMLEVIDRALSAALREVRRARALSPPTAARAHRSAGGKRMSQTSICLDILEIEGRPMHASSLIAALESRGVHASRESLVSAITKRLSPRGPFVRTAANTFGLTGWDNSETNP